MARFSQLEISKHKGQVLDKIMSWKRQEVQRQLEEAPLEQLKALAAVAEPPLDFAAALTAEAGASLIAEVKRASPSKDSSHRTGRRLPSAKHSRATARPQSPA